MNKSLCTYRKSGRNALSPFSHFPLFVTQTALESKPINVNAQCAHCFATNKKASVPFSSLCRNCGCCETKKILAPQLERRMSMSKICVESPEHSQRGLTLLTSGLVSTTTTISLSSWSHHTPTFTYSPQKQHRIVGTEEASVSASFYSDECLHECLPYFRGTGVDNAVHQPILSYCPRKRGQQESMGWCTAAKRWRTSWQIFVAATECKTCS